MKEFIETGKIVNIHGLRGEVKIMPWSDDPDFICGFDILYCGKDKKIFEIESARVHKNMVLIKFKGIDTPESANFLRNNIVYIDRNDVELEEGTYFIADLIGLEVYTDDGKLLGKVEDIYNTGSKDIYVVKDELGKQVLLPGIDEVIKEVKLDDRIIVHLIPGLI